MDTMLIDLFNWWKEQMRDRVASAIFWPVLAAHVGDRA
jgi:hypothetical protein